ncbi:MAG: ABC transporter ATP-binding protein [Clostridia bacterium]|jgi:ATP-binding cassette subfamily B multidrug efflux pump
MLKLAKYLKPFAVMIGLAIILLFVQAMTDLALPDYTSNIVNKGIQQGGIVNAVPEALRKSQMDRLILFMHADEREKALQHYTLVDKTNGEYEEAVKKYPALAREPVYILNATDEAEIEGLNPIMGRAFLTVSGMEKLKESAKDGVISFNDLEFPDDTDLYALFAQLPEEEASKLLDTMNRQFRVMDESMITQSAVPLVKEEYDALGMDTGKIQSSYILKTGMMMLLIALLGAACTVVVGFLSARIGSGLSRDLRRAVFSKVESFSNTEFDRFSTASLITRTTNDVMQVQMLVIMMIRMIIYAPIMGIGGVIRAISKSPSMSWIIAVGVIALVGLVSTIFSIATPKFKIMQKLVDRLNLVTRENLSGMMVIRAFNTQEFEEKRFDRANQELMHTGLFINRVMISMFPVMTLIMNGITILIIWVGAHRIAESSMQVGDMMAFMQYAMQIIFSFLTISMTFVMLPRASVSAQRVSEVLETEPVIRDPEQPKLLPEDGKGVVEFRNVSFRYPGAKENMLKNISFKALPGQTTAFIGSTGSGKTTLVNLIPRFYDVTEGQVLVDGVDVRDLSQHELREKIGFVPQKASLFSGTIESNLKYGDENAGEEEIRTAARIAQALDFIDERPEGMGAEIAQGGMNVSGGQRQRLSIARALVKKPPTYIFDDSFSALDFKTDAALRKALKSYAASSTLLIVAQRVATIMNADQIIVLDNGRVAGIGTHQELMESCETYQEIALSQLSKEELA